MVSLEQLNKEISYSDILDELILKKDDIVFLSGSVVEGIGNSKSDLDIFVITKSLDRDLKEDYEKKYSKTKFLLINDISCDIEYWDYNYLNKLISEISDVELTDYTKRTATVVDTDILSLEEAFSLVHRLIVGIPIYNQESYYYLKNVLKQENYFIILKRYHVNVIDNNYEDIIGNLESQEYETAYILLQQCLVKGLCAYLLHKGVSIDREKWAFIKLRILASKDVEVKEVYEKFNRLYFTGLNDRILLEKLCKKHLHFLNEIVRKCSL